MPNRAFNLDLIIPFPKDYSRGPFRKISWELELCGDTYSLRRLLAHEGFCYLDVEAFNYRPSNSFDKLLYMKTDGTVDGEFVFERLDLTCEDHANAFLEALACIKEFREANGQDSIRITRNCGGHLHVDANNYGLMDLFRLYELVGFLEETLFRIAGAGYYRGHRSLAGNTTYAVPIQKLEPEMIIQDKVRRLVRHLGRYAAVNGRSVVHPWRGQEDCSCPKYVDILTGKHYQYPEEVDTESLYNVFPDLKKCNHRNSTVEWRVFNATLHPEIILSWICLVQACHAYCWRPADNKAYMNTFGFKPNPWSEAPWNRLWKSELKAIEGALDFMFKELPLFAYEKDLLAFVCQRYTKLREIGGPSFWDTLTRYPFKKPPYVDSSLPESPRKIHLGWESEDEEDEDSQADEYDDDDYEAPNDDPPGGAFFLPGHHGDVYHDWMNCEICLTPMGPATCSDPMGCISCEIRLRAWQDHENRMRHENGVCDSFYCHRCHHNMGHHWWWCDICVETIRDGNRSTRHCGLWNCRICAFRRAWCMQAEDYNFLPACENTVYAGFEGNPARQCSDSSCIYCHHHVFHNWRECAVCTERPGAHYCQNWPTTSGCPVCRFRRTELEVRQHGEERFWQEHHAGSHDWEDCFLCRMEETSQPYMCSLNCGVCYSRYLTWRNWMWGR